MKKNIFLIITFILTLVSFSYGAGSGGDGKVSSSSDYDKGAYIIKKAKKLEKKGKIEKAKKRYKKALNYLIKSNENNPNQPDTLNYLGFAHRKLGNFKEAERYYLQGLSIEPNHHGINEYLGELYIQTNRMNLAKERLDVLKNCKCEEYEELKELIENI
tara:strand:- start:702 stop:1178 length:477 start_codon:yes stop_codon:yes gene_type:complete